MNAEAKVAKQRLSVLELAEVLRVQVRYFPDTRGLQSSITLT